MKIEAFAKDLEGHIKPLAKLISIQVFKVTSSIGPRQ